jgi:ElaB/YqjD/DUF883 family membrane-anchored ribosome-binding protein
MSTQADAIERDKRPESGAAPTTLLQSAGSAASDAAERLSDAAQAAGRQAKDAASDLAAEANQNVKGLLNDQIAVGAGVADHVAEAIRVAADTLRPDAPRLAGVIRTAAGTIEDFSGAIRGRSVDDLLQTASDFTRRQPAAAFGAAALAGFFLFRVLKAGGAEREDNRGSDRGQSGEPLHGE